MKLITQRAVTFFFINGVIPELFTTKFFVLLMYLFINEDVESCMRSMQMTSIFGRVVCWKCWRAVKYDLLISCCGCATLKELSRIAFIHNIHLIIFDVYCGSWKMALMLVTLRIVKDMRPPWWFVYKSVVINMDGLNENLSAQQTRTTYSQATDQDIEGPYSYCLIQFLHCGWNNEDVYSLYSFIIGMYF